MTKISARQALRMANDFMALATKTMNYRFANWSTLSETEKEKLELQESRLLNSANSLITAAVDTVLDDARTSLKDIRAATGEANKVVKKVAKAKAVISVVTNAAKLASAVLAQDLKGIAKAAKATYDSATKAAA